MYQHRAPAPALRVNGDERPNDLKARPIAQDFGHCSVYCPLDVAVPLGPADVVNRPGWRAPGAIGAPQFAPGAPL